MFGDQLGSLRADEKQQLIYVSRPCSDGYHASLRVSTPVVGAVGGVCSAGHRIT